MNDTPQVLLQHHLKTLRIPTSKSEYGRLVRQCTAESEDPLQYLSRPCELGLIERERRRFERRIRAPSLFRALNAPPFLGRGAHPYRFDRVFIPFSNDLPCNRANTLTGAPNAFAGERRKDTR